MIFSLGETPRKTANLTLKTTTGNSSCFKSLNQILGLSYYEPLHYILFYTVFAKYYPVKLLKILQ